MPQNESSYREDRVNAAIAVYLQAVDRGEAPDRDKFLADHADLAAELKSFFTNHSQFRQAADLNDAVESAAAGEESACFLGQTDTFHAEPLEPAPAPTGPLETGQPESSASGDIPVLPAGAVLGRYIIVRCLGRGGFGAVYLARDEELRRSVAVKVPRLEKSASSQLVEQMLQEARTVAQLQHPGIVSVFDSGRTSDGNPYFVMEYVTGSSLEELLKSEQVATNRAVKLVADLADATHFLHRRCFVHRDLKPGNILIGGDGRPRLTDFGMAVHENQQRARAGELAGTLPYMAPEQLRGEVHRIDGRTDIWGLGVILYRLLAGRLPFSGNTPAEIVDEILNREPKPVRQINDQVPAELEDVCRKCLAKEMTDRYATAADVAGALRGHLEQASGSAESRVRIAGNGEKRVELATRMGKYGCSVSMAVTVCLLVIPAAIYTLNLGWFDSHRPRAKSLLRNEERRASDAVAHKEADVDKEEHDRADFASEAGQLFELVDTDIYGEISEEEFNRSLLVRVKFKNAGISPTFPLKRDVFLKIFPQRGVDSPLEMSTSLKAFDDAIRLHPKSAMEYQRRGKFFAENGDLVRAAEDFGLAYALMPANVSLAQIWAYLLFSSGNVDEYREVCAQLRERFGASDDAKNVLILSRILILSPEAIADTAFLVQLAQKAVTLDTRNWWSHHVLGGAYVRNGQYEEVLKTLDEIGDLQLVTGPPDVDLWLSQILNDSLRAMSLLKLDRPAEARPVLERLLQSSEQHLRRTPDLPFGEITPFWWNWYPIQAFRHEAEELLYEADSAGAPVTDKRTEAERIFELADKDKNGEISEDEFDKSLLVRLRFQSANVDAKFPIARDQFLKIYPDPTHNPAAAAPKSEARDGGIGQFQSVTKEHLLAKVPKSFSFDLDPKISEPEPGKRVWTRVDDKTFVERYPSGKEGRLKILGRMTVAGTDGTIVEKVGFERVQVFIPDRDTATMEIKYRSLEKPDEWVLLGAMENVE
jgi:serine/threonine protein kinase/tetratricopeptide (TPR) repeat protein